MPHDTSPSLRFATEAVAHVLAGKTADGAAELNLAIPFTKNPASRAAAADLIDHIATGLGQLSTESYTALTAKLLAHLTKTGSNPDQIKAFPASALIEAFVSDPNAITAATNLSAVMKAHQAKQRQAQARAAQTLSKTVPPRRTLWSTVSRYTKALFQLEEAADPRHLRSDSLHLRHCIGTSFNMTALGSHGIDPNDPQAILFLRYWMRIKAGTSRIFTLTKNGTPRATLEYDVKSHLILQIRTVDNETPRPSHRYYFKLCEALHNVRESLDISGILDMPTAPFGKIIAPDGAFRPTTRHSLKTALGGTVTLTNNSPDDFVVAATSARLITSDITGLSDNQITLVGPVAGSLETHGKAPLALPRLEDGHIKANKATTLDLPRHRTGSISAELATLVNLPMHEVGFVHAPNARECGR